jgi:hypothetical protein
MSSVSEYVCGIRNDSYSIKNVTGKVSEARYGKMSIARRGNKKDDYETECGY